MNNLTNNEKKRKKKTINKALKKLLGSLESPQIKKVEINRKKQIFDQLLVQPIQVPYTCDCLSYFRKPIKIANKSICAQTQVDSRKFYIYTIPIEGEAYEKAIRSLFINDYFNRTGRKILLHPLPMDDEIEYFKTLFREYVLWFSLIPNIPTDNHIQYLQKKENRLKYHNYIFSTILNVKYKNPNMSTLNNPFITIWGHNVDLYVCRNWGTNTLIIPDMNYFSGWLQYVTEITQSVIAYQANNI